MYINFPVSINFATKGKSYRLDIDMDGITLYQIFEDDDDKEVFSFEF